MWMPYESWGMNALYFFNEFAVSLYLVVDLQMTDYLEAQLTVTETLTKKRDRLQWSHVIFLLLVITVNFVYTFWPYAKKLFLLYIRRKRIDKDQVIKI
jgi:hypothetical protein